MKPDHQAREADVAASDYDMRLEELKQRSVDRLAAAEVFDETSFRALKDYLCEKAEKIRLEHVISKQVLICLREAIRVIESRAKYIEEIRAHIGWADEFEKLLDLLIAGEGCSDRVPGVPRIV